MPGDATHHFPRRDDTIPRGPIPSRTVTRMALSWNARRRLTPRHSPRRTAALHGRRRDDPERARPPAVSEVELSRLSRGLGVRWALPFRAIFKGVGKADPDRRPPASDAPARRAFGRDPRQGGTPPPDRKAWRPRDCRYAVKRTADRFLLRVLGAAWADCVFPPAPTKAADFPRPSLSSCSDLHFAGDLAVRA